jgi:glutamate dehydrogenase
MNSLLDCMMAQKYHIYEGHMKGKKEILYFGPDENTLDFMDLGADLAKVRGYPYWKALTSSKSVRLGGLPYNKLGMTSEGMHTFVLELLKELGEEETNITKFQTGGPHGDLAGREILISKDRTVTVVDSSGVLYDPAGLDRTELVRLVKARLQVREFSRSKLGKDGFLILAEEKDIRLPDKSFWKTGAELRDSFHLSSFAKADLFVPCGGRPSSITSETVQHLFSPEGTPKFRMIVEGANLYMTDGARNVLEKAGVHLFKDSSANKGGVCSSSLEVLSVLAMEEAEHEELMSHEEGSEPPEFYTRFVSQTRECIIQNAQREFRTIWACNKAGMTKQEATKKISSKIDQLVDHLQEHLRHGMAETERDLFIRSVLPQAVPPLMVERIGVDKIIARVPTNFLDSIVGSWVASRFVYKHGVSASEVAFFYFMRSLYGQRGGGEKSIAAELSGQQGRQEKRPAGDAEADKVARQKFN